MALKGDYKLLDSDVSFACDVVAAGGTVLCHSVPGSGIGLGARAGVLTVPASSSGAKPYGVLMHDVVSIDQTRFHLNFQKVTMPVGAPVEAMRKGWLVTDNIVGTPAADGVAYLSSSGAFTPTLDAAGGTAATPKVGKFTTAKDEAGFARIDVDFPYLA